MPEFRFTDETEVKAAQLMTPDMANFVGNVHGGHVLLFCDNIAYACASRYAGTSTVTAPIDRVDFLQPVHVGELLHVVARVVFVGRTSLDLAVDVYSENFETGETRHTTSCFFTMVALKDGRPFPVPRLHPRHHGDKVRYLEARLRRELGKQYQQDASGATGRWAHLEDAELDTDIARDATPPPPA